ncbi:hypothetical protein T310_7344 [Rasamsonia emersonii CBS 393.64]|uniref:Uncharacterized protein n=1 Tax=Rasamsonia emersonii (strain ATCC 16479 / CBS 393.64 / IMI 116815) TaxID=1408163 RepID=A0A0F4YM64_RASE3|nr:hypothetical protein T310_7344 [Rasamsonia emersonii CBS 393.64]KKA18703.1 hypothetical protein T310_7344 [Rasamsonia emersonii CBS 393.64]
MAATLSPMEVTEGHIAVMIRGQQKEKGPNRPEKVIRPRWGYPAKRGDQPSPCSDNERQPRSNLYALDDRNRNGVREQAQETRDAEKENASSHEEAGGSDLARAEGICDRNGSNRFHRLHRERYPKDKPCKDIEHAGEDQRAGQRNGSIDRQGDGDGQEGAQIAQRTRDLREGLLSEDPEIAGGDFAESLYCHSGVEIRS